MSSCEKCWQDAKGDPYVYERLIKTRQCLPEEQAGLSATICPDCNRLTVHQYTGKCQNPDCLCGEYHKPEFTVTDGPASLVDTAPIICEGCGKEINPDYGRCIRCG